MFSSQNSAQTTLNTLSQYIVWFRQQLNALEQEKRLLLQTIANGEHQTQHLEPALMLSQQALLLQANLVNAKNRLHFVEEELSLYNQRLQEASYQFNQLTYSPPTLQNLPPVSTSASTPVLPPVSAILPAAPSIISPYQQAAPIQINYHSPQFHFYSPVTMGTLFSVLPNLASTTTTNNNNNNNNTSPGLANPGATYTEIISALKEKKSTATPIRRRSDKDNKIIYVDTKEMKIVSKHNPNNPTEAAYFFHVFMDEKKLWVLGYNNDPKASGKKQQKRILSEAQAKELLKDPRGPQPTLQSLTQIYKRHALVLANNKSIVITPETLHQYAPEELIMVAQKTADRHEQVTYSKKRKQIIDDKDQATPDDDVKTMSRADAKRLEHQHASQAQYVYVINDTVQIKESDRHNYPSGEVSLIRKDELNQRIKAKIQKLEGQFAPQVQFNKPTKSVSLTNGFWKNRSVGNSSQPQPPSDANNNNNSNIVNNTPKG